MSNLPIKLPPDAPPRSRWTIGRSEEGRPIRAEQLGDPRAACRVLVLAGQHGDEPLGRQAATALPSALSGEFHLPPTVQTVIVSKVNPDGAHRRTRTNRHGVDLNRDHQQLIAAETQAVHRLVRRWRPQLIVDVHTYPPRRKRLLADHLVYCHDVFLDAPSSTSLLPQLAQRTLDDLVEPTIAGLIADGFRAARYTIVTASGRVRHSTSDVADARGGLALRYGVPTVLLEGRQSTRADPPSARLRTTAALVAALRRLVLSTESFCRQTIDSGFGRSGQRVAIQSRYVAADVPREMAFADARTGAVHTVCLPGTYTPTVMPTLAVTLPRAYAVPRTARLVLDILDRHGFACEDAPSGAQRVEAYRIEAVEPSPRIHRAPRRIEIGRTTSDQRLDGHLLFPARTPEGAALAVMLEPHSKYGLGRFNLPLLGLQAGTIYPILRVL